MRPSRSRLFAALAAAAAVTVLAAPPDARASWPDLSQAPASAGGGARDAAVIVGIEKYVFVPPVPGAEQNAKDWFSWLTRSRGVPYKNVTILRNHEGVREAMLTAAQRAAQQVGRGGTLWFVFVGHGAPAKSQRDGMLIGADAQQSAQLLYARSLAQKELLAVLEKGRQQHTIAVIDACFSGRTASGRAIAGGLQPLLAVKPQVPKATVVLAAGKPDEFAGPLKGAARPAFSYLVLGALRGWGDGDGDGRVTVDEALRYTRDTLQATVKDRIQTPQLWSRGKGDLVLANSAREAGPDLGAIILGEPAASRPVVPTAPTPAAPAPARPAKPATAPPAAPAPVAAGPDEATIEKFGLAFNAWLERRYDEAFRLVSEADFCTRRHARGCNLLGVLYQFGQGVPRDLAKARGYYRKAIALAHRECDAGRAEGCYVAALRYANRLDGEPQNASAAPLYDKACQGSVWSACVNLGHLYEVGTGVTKDEARAQQLHQRACDHGLGLGCANLAKMAVDGRGGPKDKGAAVRYNRKGCDAGHEWACVSLGYAYVDAVGVAKDVKRGVALFRRACDNRLPGGCAALGWAHEKGHGVTRDPQAAATLYRGACEAASGYACHRLADLTSSGALGPADEAGARALYQKACDLKHQPACDELSPPKPAAGSNK